MSEEEELLVVSALTHCVKFNRIAIVQRESDLSEREIDFLIVRAHIAVDPVLLFWRAQRSGALTEGCHVLFLGIEEKSGWGDLTQVYRGTKFGNLYLMRYKKSLKPGVLPSQRGMYMK